MRKLRFLVLLTALLLLCSGCGTSPAPSADLQKLYDSGMAAIEKAVGDAPYMEQETDKNVLEMMYPGIGEVDTQQLLVCVSPMSGMPAEVVMIEAKDTANAKRAEDILKARVASQSADSFYPATVAQWKNAAKVTVNGNYVMLAVMPEGVDLPDEFLAKF